MLLREPSTNETVSDAQERGEEFPRDTATPPRPTRPPVRPAPTAMLSQGDAVVFARIDLAEILGIWRHARGRVVAVNRWGGETPTVDVAFDGYATLGDYLPELFRRVP